MTAPFSVGIRDSALARIGALTRLTSLEVIPRFNAVGAWTLTVPLGSTQAGLFAPGRGVIIYRGDDYNDVVMSGPVRRMREVWGDSDTGEGTLEVSGPDDNQVIADRVAWPTPGSELTSQTVEYDRRSGVGETIIREYVDLNAGPGALLRRRVSGLTLAADGLRGSSVKGSARMVPLDELITGLALSAGLGWRVVQVGTGLQFQLYEPADRTLTARFSRELGNLISYEYTREAAKVTAAIVGGGGEGTARVFRETADTDAQTAWAHRSEKFIDRRDTTDTVEIDQAGAESVVEEGPTTGLSIETQDIPRLKFGADYGLGDKVTVEPAPGVKVADVLREVKISWSASDGDSTRTEVGSANTTGTPRWIKALQKLNAKVAALEAKR